MSWHEVWSDDAGTFLLRPTANGFEIVDPRADNTTVYAHTEYLHATYWLFKDGFKRVERHYTAIESPSESHEALTEQDLLRMDALSSAATKGPWTSFLEGRDHVAGSNFIQTASDDIELNGATIADQDFIASARQDVPRLVAEVRALRAALAKRT